MRTPPIQLVDRIVDLDTHRIRGEFGTTSLTAVEGKLLARLVREPGTVVSKADLLDAMGYREGVQTRALDAAVRRLRKKLECEATAGTVLIGVYGVGYRLDMQCEIETALLGRAQDIRAVEAVLKPGVLTLLGPGGVGKTSLARVVRARWAGPSVFVDLVAAVDAPGLIEGVSRELDIPLLSSSPEGQRDQIGAVLAARGQILVVLDNTEQVADEAMALLERWVGDAPACTLLLTSRRSPGVGQSYDVAPLSLADGVALYAKRAGERLPGFTLDDTARVHVQAFVRAVDSLPLAIEIAASRVTVLAPSDLAQRAARLSLRGEGSNHRASSLQQCIQWSWQLLDAEARLGWLAAAAFEGGFTLEAWECVAAVAEPLDVLDSLLAHQLVRAEPDVGERRYGMLNALHQFARDRLAESPLRAEIECRHWTWFANTATAVSRRTEATGDHRWQQRAYGNLRVAFERALGTDNPAAVECLRALEVVFKERGPNDVRIQLLTRCLAALDDAAPELRALVLARLAIGLSTVGQTRESLERSAESHSLLGQLSEARDRARILLGHGAVLLYAGQTDAAVAVHLQGAVEAAAAGDDFLNGLTHYNRGYGLILLGHRQAALEASHLAVALLSKASARLMIAAAHSLVAYIHLQDGALPEARVALETAAASIDTHMGLIWLDIRTTRAHLELAAGDAATALLQFEEALGEAERVGFENLHADLHTWCALAHAELQQWGHAEQRFAQARASQLRLNRPAKAAYALGLSGANTWIRGETVRGLARLRGALEELEGADPLFALPIRCMLIVALARTHPAEAKVVFEGVSTGTAGDVLTALAEIAEAALRPDAAGDLRVRASRLRGSSPDVRLALRMVEECASTDATDLHQVARAPADPLT